MCAGHRSSSFFERRGSRTVPCQVPSIPVQSCLEKLDYVHGTGRDIKNSPLNPPVP